MGNTVTCCVSPDASPKLSRARGGGGGGAAPGPDRWADAYQAAAGSGGGGSGSAEAESGDSDPGGGGPHLQHISDREFPDGERWGPAGGRAVGSAGHRIPAPPAVVPAVPPPRSAAGGCPGGPAARGAALSPPAVRPLCPGGGGSVRSGERLLGGGPACRRPAPGRAPSKVPRGCHRSDSSGVSCGHAVVLPPNGGSRLRVRDLFPKCKPRGRRGRLRSNRPRAEERPLPPPPRGVPCRGPWLPHSRPAGERGRGTRKNHGRAPERSRLR